MKFNENIYHYACPQKFQRGTLGSDIFIIKGADEDSGEKSTVQFMIEAGPTVGGIGKENIVKMQNDGIDIKKTNGIFLTHPHADHITGIQFYQQQSGSDIPVYFNKDHLDPLKDPRYLSRLLDEEMGIFNTDLKKMPTPMVDVGFDFLWGKRMPVTNLIGIEEGQKFNLDNDSYIEVISTPGHTNSHLSYLLHCSDGQNVLFSGDVISFKDADGELLSLASINNPLSMYEQEVSTLEKLYDKDIDVLFTSHYGSYSGKDIVKNYIKEAVERIKSFRNSVIEELTKQPLNIKDLTERVITMKHYLSGYSTRKSTIFVILKYLMSTGEVNVDRKTRIFNINHGTHESA